MSFNVYTAYNKEKVEPGALLANYVEERALQQKTGTHRGFEETMVRVEPRGTLKRGTLPGPMASTFLRTIEHTEQQAVADWKATQRDYRGEWSQDDHFTYVEAGMGPRERKDLEALRALASAPPPVTPPEQDLTSTHRAAFTAHEPLPADQRGRRVMKDRDGRPVVRDPTFLAETGILPRAEAERHLVTPEGLSDATLRGTGLGGEFLSTTLGATGLTQPMHMAETYRRYAEFTRPIGDPVKARKDGVWAREH